MIIILNDKTVKSVCIFTNVTKCHRLLVTDKIDTIYQCLSSDSDISNKHLLVSINDIQ